MSTTPHSHTESATESGIMTRLGQAVETKIGKIGASTAIVLGAFTLSACADQTPPPSPGVETSAPATPVETTPPEEVDPNAEWFAEEIAAIELGPIPEDLVQYQEMSPEDFANLSKAEQWKYTSWLTKNRDLFMDALYKYSGNVPENKPVTLSMDSDTQSVVTSFNTSLRQSMAIPEGGVPKPQESGPSGVLDQDATAKINLTVHTTVEKANEQTAEIVGILNGESQTIAALGIGGAFDSSKWEITNDTVTDETYEGMPAKKHFIEYVDNAGYNRHMTAYVYEITTFDNKPLTVASYDPNTIVG